MKQVIIDGKVFTIYENAMQHEIPEYAVNNFRRKKELHTMRLNMAKQNYRKK